MDTKLEIAKTYLQALEKSNENVIVALFRKDGQVHSPLYGQVKATVFYKKLFQDSSESKIDWKRFFENDNEAVINFTYHWTMKNGVQSAFDCVDIFDFDENNKITQLTIIYDTARTRPAFDKLNQNDPL